MIDILKSPTRSFNFLEAAEKYIDSVVHQIEEVQIYPRHGLYRDVVLLALLDKVVTTSRAVLSLVRQGFPDEAFGLSRTCIEAFFPFGTSKIRTAKNAPSVMSNTSARIVNTC
jgi:hypothetical protein